MLRYDRVDLAEMEILFALYKLEVTKQRLQAVKEGMTYEKEVEFAELDVELAEVYVDLVGAKMNMELLAREGYPPRSRKAVAGVEAEVHAAIDRLRDKLGRV